VSGNRRPGRLKLRWLNEVEQDPVIIGVKKEECGYKQEGLEEDTRADSGPQRAVIH